MSLVDQIIGAESGGDPAARNPNSSASGVGQFIDSTWLSMLRKHRPDLSDGKSDSDLLALKSDPDLSRQMTAAYAADNAGILQNAGVAVTPGSTYLAHFAGPQGAVGILNADPSTPVSSILTPAAVKANPFLQGMTAGDLAAWANRKVGGSAPLSLAASAARPQAPAPAGTMGAPQPTTAQPQAAAPAGAPVSGPLIPEFTDAPAVAPLLLPLLRPRFVFNPVTRRA
jgi:hypothetical protein